MTKIIFEYQEKGVRDPLYLGEFEQGEDSEVFALNIKHNSNKPIRDCGLFISPYSSIYDGTTNAKEDHERIIWYADNYDSYGLSVHQYYEVFGEVFAQESGRLIDVTREEERDFFAGSHIEILDGPAAGEKVKILSYDFKNNVFYLEGDFSTDVTGQRYRIEVTQVDFIKSKNGTSKDYPIPLLYNGGKIGRLEVATITLKLSIPPFMKKAGISHIDFNMKFTPEE